MGFYTTDTLEAAPPRRAPARRACDGVASQRRRARRDPVCSRKPLRGPTRGAISGYRYYCPRLGRWLSRDPIGERGGQNEYGSFENNSIVGFDSFGLFSVDEQRINEPFIHDDKLVGESESTWEPVFSLEPCSSRMYNIKISDDTLKIRWWAIDAQVEKLDGTFWLAELHEQTHNSTTKTYWEIFTKNVLSTNPDKCVCEEETICKQKRYIAWSYQYRSLAQAANIRYDMNTYGGTADSAEGYDLAWSMFRLYVELWSSLEECQKYFKE